MTNNKCNWTSALNKYSRLNKELISLPLSPFTKLKYEAIQRDILEINKQVNWACDFLTKAGFTPLPNEYREYENLTVLVSLINKKNMLSPPQNIIITRLQNAWRQAKKGNKETVELTRKSKLKLQKLAKKEKLTMKDCISNLIEMHDSFQKGDRDFKKLTKELNACIHEGEVASDKVKALVGKYQNY